MAAKKKPGRKRQGSGVSGEDLKVAADNFASAGKALADAIRDSWKLLTPDDSDNFYKFRAVSKDLIDLKQQLEDVMAERDAAVAERGEAPAWVKARVSRLEKIIDSAQRQYDHYLALSRQDVGAERSHE